MRIREANYALRVVRRRDGDAGIVYRRRLNEEGEERLDRVAAIGTLSFAAATPLLRSAVRAAAGPSAELKEGPFYALDADWGARVACYALLAVGLRNADRLSRAATFIQHLDGAEAAWWLGLMSNGGRTRAIRALRILTEAVE
jgi:hypothetical protein